ncbi:MAG: hypothetical protein DIZ80_08125 [endosymbiont of Galathealinum brachiosum]|uniref:Uncharacterized protein n=1 Tax=endosymbiont of Galathealinum brachiosum TaxID=2200906 RepID=A0A370DGP3_9GAMM|nr:MAG: hypothetical protein DIZ80_08125 [endosymbiont of Galathealinum brachiosum]
MNIFISSNQQLYYFILRLLEVVLLSLLLITCGSSDSTSTVETQDDDQILVLPDFLANKLIGFVMDNEGELIPFASLGGASTGSVGVTTDAAIPTASGWYEVRAEGYATSYTRASGKIDDVTVISTSLTPVDAVVFHSVGGDTTVVTVGDPALPTLEANFTAATFDVDAVIELTALDPGLLDNAYADKDASENLYINYPFVISARSASDGSLLQPASGQVVEVTLTDNGDLGDPPRLFWFDPDLGMWIEQHDTGCLRVDATHVSCQLSHFSQHSGASDSPPPPSSNGTDHANASNNTDKAQSDRSKEMAIEILLTGDEPEACAIFSKEVLDAFKQEIDAALAEANAAITEINTAPDAALAKVVVAIGEAAKAKLADTAGRLQYWGIEGGGLDGGTCDHVFRDEFPDYLPEHDHPVAALKARMREVTIILGNKLLKKPQCPDIPSFDRVIGESILLLGSDHVNTISLKDEFADLLNKCNIWEGQIKYSLILPGTISITIPEDTPWFSGALLWEEYHDFSMVLHASSSTSKDEFNDFEGTDKVTTKFSQVEYRKYIDQAPCSFPVYKSHFRSGQSNPGVIEASFTGNYDDESFVPDNFTAASNININWGYFETGWEFDNNFICVKQDDETVNLSDPYRGQLVEQYTDYQYYYGDAADPGIYVFESFSYDKFLSIWDILDQGPTQPVQPTTKDSPFPVAYYKGTDIIFDAYSFGLMDGMQIIMRWEIVNTNYTKYYGSDAGH